MLITIDIAEAILQNIQLPNYKKRGKLLRGETFTSSTLNATLGLFSKAY
jgi:hypothetical protein